MKRIVINVHVESEKSRREALKIAAKCQGVFRSLSIEGESRDHVVVTGIEIDAVCLTNQMRKKFRSATLLSVEDVEEGGEEEEQEAEETTMIMENSPIHHCHCLRCPICTTYPPPYHMCREHVVYEYDTFESGCSIM